MSASPVFKAIPGVRRCWIADRAGAVLEEEPESDGQATAELTRVLSQQFDEVGTALGLGNTEMLTVRAPEAVWVIGYDPQAAAVVEVEPNRPLSNVEFALKSGSWAALLPTLVTDSQIEYLPLQVSEMEAPTEYESPDSDRPTLKLLINDSGLLASERAALRRALCKGQLALAEKIAERLSDSAFEDQDPCGTGAGQEPLRWLLEGIGCVLSGDFLGGFDQLERVRNSATAGLSLRWVCLIWIARAKLNGGVRTASEEVAQLLPLAARLDMEARAVSTLLSAEIAFQEAAHEKALDLTRKARGLFTSVKDPQEIARCWLLAARTQAALGNESESKQAAERAHQERRSWLPPAAFLAKCALNAGAPDEAERALQQLSTSQSPSSEVAQIQNLLVKVRSGSVSAQAAAEYLRLLDAPPTADSICELQALAESSPRVEQFREALGWKLLRAGDSASAAVVFERLSARGDLSDATRSSVLLALGCLAAMQARHSQPGVKLQAAVNAAPRHLQSTQPPAPSPGPMRSAQPVELSVPEPAPAPLAEFVPNESTSPRVARGGPTFSGSLQLFALPDLLDFLRIGQRTGTLVCSSVSGIGAVHLRSGKITGAASPNTPGLRTYLLKRRAITQEQLRIVSSELDGAHPRVLIGTLLVQRGLVPAAVVREALAEQIGDAIRELIGWGEGRFAFDPESVSRANPSEIELELDSQLTLLRICKQIDEANR